MIRIRSVSLAVVVAVAVAGCATNDYRMPTASGKPEVTTAARYDQVVERITNDCLNRGGQIVNVDSLGCSTVASTADDFKISMVARSSMSPATVIHGYQILPQAGQLRVVGTVYLQKRWGFNQVTTFVKNDKDSQEELQAYLNTL